MSILVYWYVDIARYLGRTILTFPLEMLYGLVWYLPWGVGTDDAGLAAHRLAV